METARDLSEIIAALPGFFLVKVFLHSLEFFFLEGKSLGLALIYLKWYKKFARPGPRAAGKTLKYPGPN